MSEIGTTPSKGSVLLVHGIRTHADWYREVRDTLEAAGFKVHLTNYGRLDLFRFLIPVFHVFRNQVKEKIFRQLRDAIKIDPEKEFSIIAHSFGTYVVSRILQDEFDVRIKRVIFAGSVVRYDFPFEQFSERFEGEILNEVATGDVWPALAESITTGYGSAGTFGFKRPRVRDRWNEGGHSVVLNAVHCKDYWLPFLENGTIVPTSASSKVPFLISLLNFIRIKYWLAVLLLGLAIYGAAVSKYRAPIFTVQMDPGSTGWQLSDNNTAGIVNAKMDEVCALEWLFGRNCKFWLAKYITKRSWRGVHQYDHSLNKVLFPGKIFYRIRDPEDFWHMLSDDYPNCIKIAEVGDDLEISYDEKCGLPAVG